MADDRWFDIVIVGAGPAGCVLARRLTEDPERTVALLEAGPTTVPTRTPGRRRCAIPTSFAIASHSWGYVHAGRPADRPLPLPRARVVGGSLDDQLLRLDARVGRRLRRVGRRGQPRVGLRRPPAVLPASRGRPLGVPLHGTDGPVPVFRATETDLTPVDRAFVAAAESLGFPRVADFNGDPVQRPGVGPTPQNVAGWHADARGRDLPGPGPVPAEPHHRRGCARRPRLRRGRPGDGRAHRRRAGGAGAAGRPLRGGVRLTRDPPPLRHRAGGGPAGVGHPRRC